MRAELEAKYSNVRFNNDGLSLSGDALIDYLSNAERAIIALENIDGSILDQLPQLKVISKYGVGIDMLDLPAMEEPGITSSQVGNCWFGRISGKR